MKNSAMLASSLRGETAGSSISSATADSTRNDKLFYKFASTELSRELWVSLVSLLRSHVAMHTVARPDVPIRIFADNRAATLAGPAGKLIVTGPDASVTAGTASGVCTMEFRPASFEASDESIVFFFDEDGLLRSERSEFALDLETAVEQWLGKVLA